MLNLNHCLKNLYNFLRRVLSRLSPRKSWFNALNLWFRGASRTKTNNNLLWTIEIKFVVEFRKRILRSGVISINHLPVIYFMACEWIYVLLSLPTIFGIFKINLMIILFKNESLLKRSPDQSGRSNWMKVDYRVIANDPFENGTANGVKWTVSDSNEWRIILKILNPWMVCGENRKGYIHKETFILKIFADSKL